MVVDYWELVSIWGPVGVALFTFATSLVPFVSPSNALIAMLIAMSFPSINKLAIGLAVALGATLAKTVHFTAFYSLGKVVSRKVGRKRVMSNYGRLTMYIMNIIAAATPIPDEWIVIPLGLTQASFIWFATTYFIGKLVITIPSAYIGHAIAPLVMEAFGMSTWVFSVVMGIAITVIFILVDVEEAMLKVLRKLGIIHDEQLKQSTRLE
ncbi:MAG: hypothetical protein QW055_00170 [Candidatus Nezhaarchaeales archaeon]